MHNWVIVYIGNVIGCLETVLLVLCSYVASLNNEAVGVITISIVHAKANLTVTEAFTRGILCNVFVCLVFWLAIGARTSLGKILAIIFTITAFAAIGLEYSIENWFCYRIDSP